MLRFFRRIRRALAEQGQMRKYLFYALGEVVLIVFGILIAIQLNTLNESRKQDTKRTQLIERLDRQIEINQIQAEEAIAELQIQLADITAVMSYIGKPKAEIDTVVVDSIMSSIIEDHHLGLDLTTLQEALDNGEISNLEDENLRTSLYSLLKANERLEQREDIANHDNNNFAIPFMYKKVNSRNAAARTDKEYQKYVGPSSLPPTDYEALFADREFENLVGSRFYYAREMMMNYQRIASFLEYLDGELEK